MCLIRFYPYMHASCLGASLWSLWWGPRRGMSRQGTFDIDRSIAGADGCPFRIFLYVCVHKPSKNVSNKYMSAPSGVTYSFLSVYARGKLGASLWSLWWGPRRGMSRQGTKQTRMGTKQTREGTKQTHMDTAASRNSRRDPPCHMYGHTLFWRRTPRQL